MAPDCQKEAAQPFGVKGPQLDADHYERPNEYLPFRFFEMKIVKQRLNQTLSMLPSVRNSLRSGAGSIPGKQLQSALILALILALHSLTKRTFIN
jgi:hypothetical protein